MLENQLSRYGSISKDVPFDRLGPTGKVFFAVHPYAQHLSGSDTGALAPWVATVLNEFPVDKDGVSRMHSTVQAAIDAATDGRGDMVLVGPGKWKEEVKVISKRNIKIFGTGGATGDAMCYFRPSDASTHYGFTTKNGSTTSGACFHIMSKGVEISGFYFDGGGNYAGIYAGGGLNGGVTGYTTENASGLYVHDCFFRGGAEGYVGLYLNGPRFGVRVENNYFERWKGGAIEVDAGNANCENALIYRNNFAAGASGYGVWIYNENNTKSLIIRENVFVDSVSAAFTYAVKNAGSTGVIGLAGNWFCCDVKTYLQGSDFTAGNYYGQVGSTTEDSNYFVSELTAGT